MAKTGRTIVITGARSEFCAVAVHTQLLDGYGDLKDVPTNMVTGFADMPASDQTLDPQLVIDAYLALAASAPGKRPTRTVVGITWGVDGVNAFTQPRQGALLKEMQLDGVLGGSDT